MTDPIATADRFHLDLMPAPNAREYRRLIHSHTPRDIGLPVWTFLILAAIIAVLL